MRATNIYSGLLINRVPIKRKMYIFDMAGTTVNENGLVYKTLKNVIKDAGFFVDDNEFHKFHGKKKLLM